MENLKVQQNYKNENEIRYTRRGKVTKLLVKAQKCNEKMCYANNFYTHTQHILFDV